VRFIRTSEPTAGWLAKNQAYDSLAQAANGEYILFCGADVRLGTRSIRQMVSLISTRNKRMVAFLPLSHTAGTIPLLQAMRYYWEMAPPRRLFNRPPVLSSSWIIERKALQRYGGFAAFKQSMSSEAHLAQCAVNDNDGYSFIRSDDNLAVASQKAVSEQRATARLRRYPQAHRRPELVLAYTVGQALLLFGPVLLAVMALPLGYGWLVAVLAGAAFVIHTIAFGLIQRPIFPRVRAWRAYAAFVPAVIADIWYLNQSMILYEFATVTWKERNVSRPVMRQPHG
jgi:ABC-type Fe3+-siderophore transport system permease subunit